MIRVRPARREDAEAMSAVLIASISELCLADHGGDRAIIASWTGNKSPNGVRAMMDRSRLFVAEKDGEVAAVGAINGRDEIGLLYVSPGARRQGVSRTLLAHLEAIMRRDGIESARLTSTATARGFYQAMGWQDAGPPDPGHSVAGHPMRKALF